MTGDDAVGPRLRPHFVLRHNVMEVQGENL